MNAVTTDPPPDRPPFALPRLIVVTGRPGSGKSALAHTSAAAIRGPAVCRDEIKEGLISTLRSDPQVHDDVARQACHVFFDTVANLVCQRVTLVAEAAFQHRRWAPRLEPLLNLARVRVIICHVTPALARDRRVDRVLTDPARARFHPDPFVQPSSADVPPDSYDPPRLGVPTLTVDTSAGYEPPFSALVDFALS
jgi:predicted kinase